MVMITVIVIVAVVVVTYLPHSLLAFIIDNVVTVCFRLRERTGEGEEVCG